MPKKKKAAKAAQAKKAKAAKSKAKKEAKPKPAKAQEEGKEGTKAQSRSRCPNGGISGERASCSAPRWSSRGRSSGCCATASIEPGGREATRDIVRHNGSVVILAIDNAKSKKNPWIVVERQYRHAAQQFLWELPAGKLDPGEEALAGRPARTGRGDRLPRQEMEAAGRVLPQPRLSGRVDEGFRGRGPGRRAMPIRRTTNRSNSAWSNSPS